MSSNCNKVYPKSLPSSCDYMGADLWQPSVAPLIQFKQVIYDTTSNSICYDWECQLPMIDHITNQAITLTSDGSLLPANIPRTYPVEVRVSLDNGVNWHYKSV